VAKRGMPTTAEEARAVLAMRGLVWFGTVIAATCVLLAVVAWSVGHGSGNTFLTWIAPVFFVLCAVAWAGGVRRMRLRLAAARALLAAEPPDQV
jgi:hypothetical protein